MQKRFLPLQSWLWRQVWCSKLSPLWKVAFFLTPKTLLFQQQQQQRLSAGSLTDGLGALFNKKLLKKRSFPSIFGMYCSKRSISCFFVHSLLRRSRCTISNPFFAWLITLHHTGMDATPPLPGRWMDGAFAVSCKARTTTRIIMRYAPSRCRGELAFKRLL